MALTADDCVSMAPAIIYQEVKAWIAQQEAYEAQHNKPAPLTDVQRMALETLRQSTPVSSSTHPAVAVAGAGADAGAGEFNYIGVLLEHYQKPYRLNEISWIEEASGILTGGVTGRVCRVTIKDSLAHESGPIENFPAVGYGLNADGCELPRFTNKKDAKRFAARCALEWLAAQGLLAPHLHATLPSPRSQTPRPAALALKRAPQSTSSSPAPPPPPQKRQTVTAPMARDASPEAAAIISSPGESQRSPIEAVAALCHELNFPAPTYVMVETNPVTQVFRGWAHFDNHGDAEITSLAEAGVVEGVRGKDVTKRAIAAKVLKRLQEIEAARAGQLQQLMDSRGGQMKSRGSKWTEDV